MTSSVAHSSETSVHVEENVDSGLASSMGSHSVAEHAKFSDIVILAEIIEIGVPRWNTTTGELPANLADAIGYKKQDQLLQYRPIVVQPLTTFKPITSTADYFIVNEMTQVPGRLPTNAAGGSTFGQVGEEIILFASYWMGTTDPEIDSFFLYLDDMEHQRSLAENHEYKFVAMSRWYLLSGQEALEMVRGGPPILIADLVDQIEEAVQ